MSSEKVIIIFMTEGGKLKKRKVDVAKVINSKFCRIAIGIPLKLF